VLRKGRLLYHGSPEAKCLLRSGFELAIGTSELLSSCLPPSFVIAGPNAGRVLPDNRSLGRWSNCQGRRALGVLADGPHHSMLLNGYVCLFQVYVRSAPQTLRLNKAECVKVEA
jgi:hypothetical protein